MKTQRPRGPSAEVLQARCIADLLQMRAEDTPDKVVYHYLLDDESGEQTLTFGQLYDEARRVATCLLEHVDPRERAILLFGSGLDFVVAFMGCQIAGVVPVPVMPPRSADPAELGRVMAIMDDVGTKLIVTSEALLQMGRAFIQGSGLHWMSVEKLDGVAMTEPIAFEDAGQLALLQYTSGSTSRPRGVMVGHDNLMCNLADIYWAEGNTPETISVSWLPMSHDMGLIEGVLQPLFRGSPVYLMSPLAFLRRPLRWLEVISKVRAQVSGGPNFAYDLVLRRLGEAPPPDLDLSCWRFAYNGSEPVSDETIRHFSERLACRGFRPESMHALFGIAEATLGVTEGRHQRLPRTQQRVGPGGLRSVVSCGIPAHHTEIAIVDPDTHRALPDGEEGELWIHGPCVTRGYWRQPQKSAEVFEARIEGRAEPFLRTGDLGFIVDGEVYVSGRIKEVIISRGKNIYPQDMEVTAQKAHPMIRPGGVVAFAMPGHEGAAGLVAELDKKALAEAPLSPQQFEEIARAVRRALTAAHGVPIHVTALVKPGSLPRTTSGKRQRLRVAKMVERGKLKPLFELTRSEETSELAAEIYLRQRVAAQLGLDPESLDDSLTLAELGLDSLRALDLLIDVEARFPDLSLVDMLTSSLSDLTHRGGSRPTAPWVEDAVLPDDIRCPADPTPASSDRILLTGITGFLGGHVAARLLESSEHSIVALVRGERAQERVLEALRRQPGWRPQWRSRLEVVQGDLGAPDLGLKPDALASLGDGLAGIFHVAAMVNWVYPYSALSNTNVGGTKALLRLACQNATPLVYVSTSAVGWSLGATQVFDEDTDPMTHIEGIHLDYVRTKAVAESLVRQAAQRGLPATIVRPGLIFSHSETGVHSPGDFLSALLKGCVEMGAAPDLDWALEACTVDDVSRAMVHGVRHDAGVTTLHIEAPQRRLWRGAVLWMALRGYEVELMAYDRWCERLKAHAADPSAALRPLLPFFTRPVDGLGGLRLPQLYEEQRRNPVNSQKSRLALQDQQPRGLTPALLDKTFDHLVDCGYMPAASAASPSSFDRGDLNALCQRIALCQPGDRLLDLTPIPWHGGSPGEHGIIGELASWRHGAAAGLRRVRMRWRDERGDTHDMSAVLKTQVPDTLTLDVGQEVAQLCSPRLGEAWRRHRAQSEVQASHLREAAIYALQERPLAQHRPTLYGAGEGLLLIEDLTGAPMLNSAHTPWGASHISAAIEGVGAIHADWLGTPPTGSWLAPPRQLGEQRPLWEALAEFALEQPYGGFLGSSGAARYRALLSQVDAWSDVSQSMPQTLIHNDFNPRNVAIRADGRLCAYDWELARVGPAQRDLAELLCFTLRPDVSAEELASWVERHRAALERGAAQRVDEDAWRLGFGAALADFAVTRLPLYAMVGRFHPQPFLERVVKTWATLDRHMGFKP